MPHGAVPVALQHGLVDGGPLLQRLSWMRRQALKKHGVVSAGGQLCFPVVGFAQALQEEASTDILALLANSLCWLSRLVDA
eukprot:12080560-Prorocentrum_lima.AAC.1